MHAPLRLWLRFIGVEFWLVALVPFQIGFIVGAQAWSSRAGLLGLATVALLTASSFVLNHLCDLETDRRNPRKAFSLLVRGDLTLAAGWALFGALQVATLALAALAGRDFLLCLLGLTAISLAYNIAPLRLKERPGLDIAANGASLGFLLPLAGWSLSQPLGEFPRLYFASVVCYLVAFYCPTMAVDVVADRAVGTITFATHFGAVATMRLSWAATTAGAVSTVSSAPSGSSAMLWMKMEIAKKCAGPSSISCVTAPRSKPTSVTTRRRSSAKGRRASAAASAPAGECWSR